MTNVAVHLEVQQPLLQTHAHDAIATGAAHVKGQQHPIKLYLVVWGWLFVLSTCSYLVDYFGLHGYLRWSLILLFVAIMVFESEYTHLIRVLSFTSPT